MTTVLYDLHVYVLEVIQDFTCTTYIMCSSYAPINVNPSALCRLPVWGGIGGTLVVNIVVRSRKIIV